MSKEELNQLKSDSPVASIFDFTERLSPMLVKELRQGLRSPSFTSLFLSMQGILMLIIFFLAISDGDAAKTASSTIFMIYGITVCIIQPLRAINAISSEIKNDTIDLIVLTKLSSWKIVFGKWVSLMGQTLIVTISLLPYLILRYFLGGMQLFEELTIFYMIFITATVTTAIAVGMSALSSLILRIIFGGGMALSLSFIFCFVLMIQALQALYGSGFTSSSINLESLLWSALAYTIVGLYISWIMLDFGASMISPVSENRAIARRLSYLAILLIGVVTTIVCESTGTFGSAEVIQLLMLMLLVPFLVSTLTENPYITPRTCQPLLKKPYLRPLRYFLYPGWSTGYLFILPVIFTHVALTSITDETSFTAFMAVTITSLIFPAALMSLFGKNNKSLLTFYLITLIGSVILFGIISLGATITDEHVAILFFWNPPCLYYLMVTSAVEVETVIALSILMTVVYSIIIFVRSGSIFEHIGYQENQARRAIQQEKENLETH